MVPETTQAIIQACTSLYIDYARHVDFGEYDAFANLFTPAASLDLGFKLIGQEKIRHSMSKRSDELRSRHVLTNISIDVHDNSHASGIAYLTLYRHIGKDSLQDDPITLDGPAGIGHYSNTFELTNEGWRIASSTLRFAFKNPAHFPT